MPIRSIGWGIVSHGTQWAGCDLEHRVVGANSKLTKVERVFAGKPAFSKVKARFFKKVKGAAL